MSSFRLLSLSVMALLAFSMGACDTLTDSEVSRSLDTSATHAPSADQRTDRAILNRQLAEVRRVTAPFHNVDNAVAAGWSEILTPCLESPEGGMGYHYGNLEYLTDGVANYLQPEALLYEPQKNGRLRLVAVEYVVGFNTDEPPPFEPPVLFGETFHITPHVGYTLHLWLWEANPSGLFADWNPEVSCQYAN